MVSSWLSNDEWDCQKSEESLHIISSSVLEGLIQMMTASSPSVSKEARKFIEGFLASGVGKIV